MASSPEFWFLRGRSGRGGFGRLGAGITLGGEPCGDSGQEQQAQEGFGCSVFYSVQNGLLVGVPMNGGSGRLGVGPRAPGWKIYG